jgi:hypothetical protein
MSRTSPILLIALLTLLPGCFPGCDDDDDGTGEPSGPTVPNETPETVLANAPPQGDTTSFHVEMEWYGTDPDGEVVGYYFAWEDTSAWTYTTSAGSTFAVCATSCVQCDHTDTLFFDYHAFWIKAVDDRGGHDPTPAFRDFTARSTAPLTTIVRGPCEEGTCAITSSNVLFEWESYDPDGGVVDSFFYKLNVGGIESVVDSTWNRVGSDCTYVRFTDVRNTFPETGRFPNFAVVAKDNAGTTERVLEPVRNWCCFEPMPCCCPPRITIYSNVMGERNNSVPSGPAYQGTVGEVSYGTPVRFWWAAAEDDFCELLGYRHAMDDTTVWSPWDLTNTEYPAGGGTFLPEVGSHTLYVQALFSGGIPMLCYFKYEVAAGAK